MFELPFIQERLPQVTTGLAQLPALAVTAMPATYAKLQIGGVAPTLPHMHHNEHFQPRPTLHQLCHTV